MSVKIPVAVKSGENGSYIQADNLVAGAQGSFNDVVLRMTLEDEWENTPSVLASFTDAHGELASTVLFLTNLMPDPVGMPHTYDIPIPVDAKVYVGDMSVVVTGFSQAAGTGDIATFSGTNSQTVFTFTGDKPFFIVSVTVGGTALPASEWSYGYADGTLTFANPPAAGTNNITVLYKDNVTASILRTADCIMRVLPSNFSVVTDDELDSSIVEQLLAELYYQRGQSAEAKASAESAKESEEGAAAAAEAAAAPKAEVIYPIVYNNSSEYPPDPTATDEGDYWYCPDEDKLYRAEGSPLAWVDYSDKLDSKNLFINGSTLCYYDEYAEPQVTPVSANPTSHTHNSSQITDFSSAVTSATAGKADKVVSATSNNFASFNTVGNIKDSGKKASDFAAASHTHTLSQITGLPVPTIADAGKYIAVNDAGEYVLVSGPGPAPTPTYTISLHGTGSNDCCCWLASDPSTVYMDENGGYMGEVEIASDDKLVCYVDNIEMAAVVVNGDTQTLVDNKCEITPTDDMSLTFNYSGGPSGESVIQIVM